MDKSRFSIPMDMANTPDDVVDFLIRVIRLKIEDLEGDIITRKKQLGDMKIVLRNDPDNATLINSINALNEINRDRIVSKKGFKTAMMKLQKQGKQLFQLEMTNLEPQL